MEHELIDYFDENGKHLGIIDKNIAHKKGLWHKSVHVWLINDKNQILMQKRCPQKNFFPNFWDCSFAGHIGTGENSLTGAIREGYEELGIKINNNDLIYLFTYKEKLKWGKITSNEFVDVYISFQNIDIKELKLQVEEVSDVKYFDIHEIFSDNRKIVPHDYEYKKLEIFFKNNIEIENN